MIDLNEANQIAYKHLNIETVNEPYSVLVSAREGKGKVFLLYL